MDKLFETVCRNKPKGCYAFEVKGVHPTQTEMRCFAYSKSANFLCTDNMEMFSFHVEDLMEDVIAYCEMVAIMTALMWG